MNTAMSNIKFSTTLIAATVAAVAFFAGCAAAPVKPAGAIDVRNKLTQLQADPELANRAPVALKEAEMAVRAAEQPEADADLAAHRVYIANQKIEIARAQAETRLAEDLRAELSAQRETARLNARTREAKAAKDRAMTAQAEAAAARMAAAASQEQSMEYQRQIKELQAKVTNRGLVLTLGDVLFATDKAELMPGATSNLNKLVTFLNKYPERTVQIEGHTDSVGSEDYNQGLSQRRAESVRSYLMGQGIEAARLTALGKGESQPVASNDSATGRQQNRRVEVVINNSPEPQ